ALDELRAGAFDHLVLTSRQGVGSIADTLAELPRAAVKIAAIGQATASALRQLGIEPAIVASDSTQEGMLEALRPIVAPGERVLLPVSDRARPVLADGLRAHGARVTRVDAYATDIVTEPNTETLSLVEKGGIGAVLLASPSAVESFIAQFGSLLPAMSGATFVAIGRVTAEAMDARGLPVHAMPAAPGATEMVDALADYLWGDPASDGEQMTTERE
ncbi:MAG TPA: uroporphyrinogen-III synthase, partial [Thermomicrobiales bacterium]|nr:uroporphyrinogen-III synthase [Thermomicrobiales bacterium]